MEVTVLTAKAATRKLCPGPWLLPGTVLTKAVMFIARLLLTRLRRSFPTAERLPGSSPGLETRGYGGCRGGAAMVCGGDVCTPDFRSSPL